MQQRMNGNIYATKNNVMDQNTVTNSKGKVHWRDLNNIDINTEIYEK